MQLSWWVKEKNDILKSHSFGYNHTRCYQKNTTTHAEVDAINKLVCNKNKKLITVNLLVIRVNSSGNISLSKPCSNCMNYMNTVAIEKGYKIKYVYYSNSDGTIERMKL